MKNSLKKQYDLRFSEIQKYRNEVWKILTKYFFQNFIPKDSDILDIGCGWGEFINNIEGRRKIGIDLNLESKQHVNSSIEFFNQDCSCDWPLPDNSLDVVYTSNFLEHLPNKSQIDKTIIQVKRCLRPSGKLICLGPNIKYLPGLYWDFWDHHIALTENSLSELLEIHDFSIEKCVAKFLPYTMANNNQPPLFFLKLYLIIPLLWKIFGKQFLIIANNEKIL
ncbi:class I SAM-dependent methyltransferase [bacterium]|nr:class I SAM-dependent methyltransferase [bacterium]